MKFILIASTGRSGSTTLQRIINTIPESNITGEKMNAITNILECYKNLKLTIKKSYGQIQNERKIFYTYEELIEKKIKLCFYNSFDFENVKLIIQKLIIEILDNKNDNRILGFKEIRYFDYSKEISLEILNEFMELFPNTKIICHIKNDITAQSKSAWFNEDKDSEKNLKNYNKSVKDYVSKNGDFAYLSTFENMFNYKEIEKLFEFLEEKAISKEDYNNIINNNYE